MKNEQQEGKAGRSNFKKGNLILRVQFLPAKFAHAFLKPEAIQQVWTCLYFSWQEHNRGKPAVRVLRYANKFFWQMPVSQLAATDEKAEAEPQPCCYADMGWAQLSSHPIPVYSGCVGPIFMMPTTRADHIPEHPVAVAFNETVHQQVQNQRWHFTNT